MKRGKNLAFLRGKEVGDKEACFLLLLGLGFKINL
jgi:hypothetical protein